MDITAYHVMFEFQNHFVEQLDDDSSDKKKKNIHYHSILSMVLKSKDKCEVHINYLVTSVKIMVDNIGGKMELSLSKKLLIYSNVLSIQSILK